MDNGTNEKNNSIVWGDPPNMDGQPSNGAAGASVGVGANENFVEEEIIPKMSYFQRLVSIVVSPVKLMQNLKHHPAIASMLITATALSLISIPFSGKIAELTNDKLAEIMLARYGQEFVNFMQSAQNTAAAQTSTSVISVIVSIVLILIACVIQALVLLIITKIAKGSAKYGQYLSMYAHVLIIGGIGTVFATVVMASMGTLLDISSLAAVLMPNGDFSMMAFNILSSITIFGIWQSALVFVGVREINGFSPTKACVLTVIMFVLGVAFTAGAASTSIFAMDISYSMMGF